MTNVALSVKAETRLAHGDSAGARKALEEVTAADPLMAGAQFQLALMLDAEGDRDGAIQRYRKVIAVQPNNAVALNNLAYALAVHKNQPEEARPFAERASRLAPREPTILDTFAWVEHLVGNHENAAKLIGAAVNGGPTNAEVRLHAAFIYSASGAPAAALAELNFAVKYDPALAARADVKALRRQLEKR
jgi:Flp pilus assembly protein TadD